MKIGARRETPKGENVENSPIKSRVCPSYIYSFYFLSFSFYLFLPPLLRIETLSLHDLIALELCPFVPFSLLFSCYPIRCRLRQKSKSFFNSTNTPDSNSGFVNRFTWKRFYFSPLDKLRSGISMIG